MQCETCRFFVSNYPGGAGPRWGKCHRYPPTVSVERGEDHKGDRWVEQSEHRPDVHNTDFCGEWSHHGQG